MTLNRHGIHQFPKAHNILNMLYFLNIIKVQIQRKKTYIMHRKPMIQLQFTACVMSLNITTISKLRQRHKAMLPFFLPLRNVKMYLFGT